MEEKKKFINNFHSLLLKIINYKYIDTKNE